MALPAHKRVLDGLEYGGQIVVTLLCVASIAVAIANMTADVGVRWSSAVALQWASFCLLATLLARPLGTMFTARFANACLCVSDPHGVASTTVYVIATVVAATSMREVVSGGGWSPELAVIVLQVGCIVLTTTTTSPAPAGSNSSNKPQSWWKACLLAAGFATSMLLWTRLAASQPAALFSDAVLLALVCFYALSARSFTSRSIAQAGCVGPALICFLVIHRDVHPIDVCIALITVFAVAMYAAFAQYVAHVDGAFAHDIVTVPAAYLCACVAVVMGPPTSANVSGWSFVVMLLAIGAESVARHTFCQANSESRHREVGVAGLIAILIAGVAMLDAYGVSDSTDVYEPAVIAGHASLAVVAVFSITMRLVYVGADAPASAHFSELNTVDTNELVEFESESDRDRDRVECHVDVRFTIDDGVDNDAEEEEVIKHAIVITEEKNDEA
jgi:hypothetical protein